MRVADIAKKLMRQVNTGPMLRSYAFRTLITIILIAIYIYKTDWYLPKPYDPKEVPAIATTTFDVVDRVVDGDTIKLESGDRVRYIGVDTPESVDPRQEVQCFGKEASEYNKKLVLDKKVTLVPDVGNTDSYDRLLRYVYLEDGTFVNLKLVQDGYAKVLSIPPNVAYADKFKQAERDAREAKRGLWGKCN